MNYRDIEIWPLLAGLGLFLFGMYMLEDALKRLAGRSFKKFLARHTGNPVKAALSGALVTGVLQSSSMVTLLVMSFTGAGIIGLQSAVGMIFGANIGTTFTGWLVTLIGFKLDIKNLIMPFIAIGGLGIVFLKTERLSQFSKFLMGFSFMFLGLDFMKSGFAHFAEHLDLSFIGSMPMIVFFFFGVVLTAAIHSSSAAIMIFLSSIAAGIITVQQGLYLVVGADLGTTATALLATIGANPVRRKVGWSQVWFNIINAAVALLLMNVLVGLITGVAGVTDPLILLVAFHTLFNLLTALLLLPFIGIFTRIINRFVSSKETKMARLLATADPGESHAALTALQKEAILFAQYSIQVKRLFFNIQGKNGGSGVSYFDLKKYEGEITEFYVRLLQVNLDKKEVEQVNNLISAIRNAALSVKAIKDIKHNLAELEQSSEDHLYDFYQKILKQQDVLYTHVEALLQHAGHFPASEIQHIQKMIHDCHLTENETIIQMHQYANHTYDAMSSLLNMVREITNSNESLYKVLSYLSLAGDQ